MAKENFSVARVETRTRASVGKFERHIERKNESYENMNVDLSRTPMNVSFKGCGELTYNEYLDQMIAAGTVSLKGLKPDAKVFDEMIMQKHDAESKKIYGVVSAVGAVACIVSALLLLQSI